MFVSRCSRDHNPGHYMQIDHTDTRCNAHVTLGIDSVTKPLETGQRVTNLGQKSSKFAAWLDGAGLCEWGQ